MTVRSELLQTTLVLALIGALAATGALADDFALGTDADQPGLLYEINLTTFATSFVTDTMIAAVNRQPNAQAWDDANQRFYYAEVQTGPLWVWLRDDDGDWTNDHYLLGDLSTAPGFPALTCGGGGGSCGLASAAFYDCSAGCGTPLRGGGPPGRYYTIPDFTDDLWEVTFTAVAGEPGVVINTVTKIADLTGDSRCWQFGDIAVDFTTGMLYGSGRVGATCLPDPSPLAGTSVEFFKADLTNMAIPFTSIKTESQTTYPLVQLTFNQPYDTLYAFDSAVSAAGAVLTVNLMTGAYTSVGNSSPVVRFRDVGGARFDTFIPVTLMEISVSDR